MEPRLTQEEIMEIVRNSDSHKKSKEANAALNELCDLLGIDLLGASIQGGGNALVLPVERVREMNARIAALKANALSVGTL